MKPPPVPPQTSQIISSLLRELSEDDVVEPEGGNKIDTAAPTEQQDADKPKRASSELGHPGELTRRSSIEKLKELLESLPPTQQQTFSPATKRRLRRVYPELKHSRLSNSETAGPAPPQYVEAGGSFFFFYSRHIK